MAGKKDATKNKGTTTDKVVPDSKDSVVKDTEFTETDNKTRKSTTSSSSTDTTDETVSSYLHKLDSEKKYISDVSKYIRYYKVTSSNHEPATGASNIYNISLVLKDILETEDYNVFKERYEIFRKLVRLGTKERNVFSYLGLSRYDNYWKWGEKAYNAYYRHIALLGGLGNNRKITSSKTLSLDNILPLLNDTAKRNLTKYYN